MYFFLWRGRRTRKNEEEEEEERRRRIRGEGKTSSLLFVGLNHTKSPAIYSQISL